MSSLGFRGRSSRFHYFQTGDVRDSRATSSIFSELRVETSSLAGVASRYMSCQGMLVLNFVQCHRLGWMNMFSTAHWWSILCHCSWLPRIWRMVSIWGEVLNGALQSRTPRWKHSSSSWVCVATALLSTHVMNRACGVMCRAFWGPLPLRLAKASMRSSCPDSGSGHHLILLVRPLMLRDLQKLVTRALSNWEWVCI